MGLSDGNAASLLRSSKVIRNLIDGSVSAVVHQGAE
jgi:hypothetical protein